MPSSRKRTEKALPPWLHLVRLAIVVLPVLWVVQQAVFGPSGWLALRQKQHQYAQERASVRALRVENRQLNGAVRALRSNPQAIEGIAREQLHLTKPGEIVYTYPLSGQPPASSASLH